MRTGGGSHDRELIGQNTKDLPVDPRRCLKALRPEQVKDLEDHW